jgi:hypothetical protein
MAAGIAGKYTRSWLGMANPRSRSFNIRPGAGGSTLHWGGAGSTIHSHATCIAIWKEWQSFHMGPARGWVDIAYTMGFCQHGWVFPGRGYGVRTAAQGTNRGNDISYAFVHINEAGKDPTAAALAAGSWLVQDAREHGGAGKEVWAHRDWHMTDCPGNVIAQLARSLDGKTIPSHPLDPQENETVDIHDIQQALLYYKIKDLDGKADINPLTELNRTYSMVHSLTVEMEELRDQVAEVAGDVKAIHEFVTTRKAAEVPPPPQPLAPPKS